MDSFNLLNGQLFKCLLARPDTGFFVVFNLLWIHRGKKSPFTTENPKMNYNFTRLFKTIGTKKYKLEVWESAPVTGDRTKPIYFKANYLLETKQEAREILDMMGILDFSKTA